jgi:hypothetical protein
MAMNPLMVRIAADAKGLEAGLNKATRSVDAAAAKMETAFRGVGVALAAVGAGGMLGSIVRTNVEFQKLSATLKVVTGSAQSADAAMKGLEDFATKTPYALDEVVGAFIKLKAMGLDPSLEALKSYGNTASAMGKGLDQFIEAIADAATGEFERLKEFGIKASKEGDKVSVTFQGVTTEIGNNAAEIEKHLQKIGNAQFAGAMDEQMATLGGAFSNLGDQVAKLERQVGEGGLNDALIRLTGRMTEVGDGAESAAAKLGAAFGGVLGGIEAAFDSTVREGERLIALFSQIMALPGLSSVKSFFGSTLDGMFPEVQGPPAPPKAELQGPPVSPFAAPKRAPAGPSDEAKKKAKKGADDAAKEAERRAKAIQDVIANLKFEQDQLARTDVEQEVYNNLKQAGVSVTSLQGQEITKLTRAIYEEQEAQKLANEDKEAAKGIIEDSLTPLDEYAKKLDKIAELQGKGFLTSTQALTAGQSALDDMLSQVDSTAEATDEAKDLARDLGLTFSSAFEEAISGGESFRNILDSIAQDLIKLGTRKLVTEPLLGAMDGILGNVMQGFTGSGPSQMPNGIGDAGAMSAQALLGTVTDDGGMMGRLSSLGGMVSDLFGGMFADGGRPPMNKMSLVGEEGPELFVPDSAGQIIPNDFFQSRGSGGGSVSAPITVNIAKGTPEDARRAAGQIAATVAQRLSTAQRRNG